MTYKLLLVDDEEKLCEALKLYLESQGFSIDIAYEVKSAWRLLHRNIYNLVISDVMMPNVDGYEFLMHLRRNFLFVKLPVILLTAKGLSQDRISAYKYGCDAYLSKPFNPEELLSIINNLLNKPEFKIPRMESKTFCYKDREFSKIYLQNTTSKTFNFDLLEFSSKEQYILNLVIQGLMNKEIARYLNTSIRNVEKYMSRLFYKTITNNRTELVKFIINNNLYI
nr:regulatory component of sensory transduction system [Cavernulicola chilensis]